MALDGTLPRPPTLNVRGVAATSLPESPLPKRVSSKRTGATGGYVAPATGVTELVGSDGRPVPTTLPAVTVNVYGWPLVSPKTVQLRAPVVAHWKASGEDVAVYALIVLPTSSAGAIQETRAEPIPAVAAAPVGLWGTVGAIGMTALDGSDSGPLPTMLVARTVKLYSVPLERPLTVHAETPVMEHAIPPRPASV